MDPQEWQDIIKAHGGKIIGHKPLYTAQQISASQDLANPQPLPPYPPMEITFADGSTTEAILYGDGSVDQTKPITPPPKTAATAAKPQIYTDPSDGSQWALNADGSKTRLTAGKAAPPTISIPDPQNPGQMIDVTPAQAQAWLNQQKADQTSASAADRIDLSQQRVDLATQKQQYSQIQQAADNEYKRLQLQVQQGQLSNSQAIAEFDRFWKMNVDAPKAQLDAQNLLYNTGQSAGMDAAKLAQMGTENMVGPGFGANFADALTGLATGDRSKVHFGAGDFTYQIPDYGAIAKNAAAAAIAHLSPYAASIAGTAAPSGYQPPGQPGVVAAAANSVVAPNPSPVQPPPYRPARFVG